jgi:phage-related protein
MTNTNNLSRTLQNTNSVPTWLAEAEDRAQKLVNELAPLCVKLKDLKPLIVELQADFKKLKGSQTIFGCRSFKEFCEQKLGRTEQAVYAMLGDYSKKQQKQNGRSSHRSTAHQQFADEDVERMRTGCNAAVKHFEAAAKGDKAEAEKAKEEFLAISKAESLKSVIFGDQPNYKLLLVQLLGMIEQVGDKVPMMLITHCRAIRKRIGIDDVSFGVQPTDRQPQGTPPAAQGAKEVSNDSFGDFSIPMEKPEQAQTAQASR